MILKIKDFIIKVKVANDRGRVWISYIQFFMLLFITITSMKAYSSLQFIFQIPYWFLWFSILSCIGIVVIGYVDFKIFKTFQLESEAMARLNPVTQRMFANQDEIIRLLKKDR